MNPYKVVIVNEPIPVQSFVSEHERIDFIHVGQQFHGRHFKGKRPLVFIDQTTADIFDSCDKEYVRKWSLHVRSSFSKTEPVRVYGNGLFAQLIRENGGIRKHDEYGVHYQVN